VAIVALIIFRDELRARLRRTWPTGVPLAAAGARRAKGESPTQIAKALGVSRASVYRHLANASPQG